MMRIVSTIGSALIIIVTWNTRFGCYFNDKINPFGVIFNLLSVTVLAIFCAAIDTLLEKKK